mgnify:CR=1 FL=1
MFQQLYDLADDVYDGPLPMHIRFLMDEFANIALPDDYHKILSTARSRNISFGDCADKIRARLKRLLRHCIKQFWETVQNGCSLAVTKKRLANTSQHWSAKRRSCQDQPVNRMV